MGEVYRARDPRLGRDVAIKLIPETFATDASRLHRFEQEARAAGPAQSSEHPGRLRRRRPRRRAVHRLRAARGRIAAQPAAGRTAAAAQGDRLRAPDRRGARRRARRQHRPPRREARQPVHHQRRAGQDSRLRHREADAAERRGARARPASPTETAAGIGRRHGGLHVAGAGARRSRRCRGPTSSASARSSTRCCRAGRRSRATPRRDDDRDSERGSAAADLEGRLAGPCAHHRALGTHP